MNNNKKQKGVVTQKMVTLRMDNENDQWLILESSRQGITKGRLINNIIRAAQAAQPMGDREKKTLKQNLLRLRNDVLQLAITLKELMDGIKEGEEDNQPETLNDIYDQRP